VARARTDPVVREKEATRLRDELSAARRRLPMVKIEKEYVFEGPNAQRACSICSNTAGS
jgi:predicted dithiol-disulfide oxidoreductase (DUF899 family)